MEEEIFCSNLHCPLRSCENNLRYRLPYDFKRIKFLKPEENDCKYYFRDDINKYIFGEENKDG